MVDTQLLESVIEQSGLKKTYLADKLGISIQNFRLKIQNKSDFRSHEVVLLCHELGIKKASDKEKIFLQM